MRDSAEDIAQEAIIAMLVSRRRVRSPRAWIAKVALRLSKSYMRQRRKLQVAGELERLLPSRPGKPLVEAYILVREILPRLPPRDRRLLEMWLAGWTHAEMARCIGCGMDSVSTLLHRSKLRALQALSK